MPHTSSNLVNADTFLRQGRPDQAEPLLRQHLRSKPNDATAREWLGASLFFQGKFPQAAFEAQRSIDLTDKSDNANLGRRLELLANVRAKEGDLSHAIDLAVRAVSLSPTAQALNLLAALRLMRDDKDGAFEPATRAYSRAPHEPSIISNYALLIGELGQPERAASILQTGYESTHDNVLLEGLVTALNYAAPGPPDGVSLSPSPTDLDAVDPTLKRSLAQASGDVWIREAHRANGPGRLVPHGAHSVTRVAFVSADMRTHSCSYFLRPLLRHLPSLGHDVIGVHVGRQCDGITEELAASSSQFEHIPEPDPLTLARRLASMKCDVIVECGGRTSGSPLPALAFAPAPLQVTYLGYPATTGLATIDARFVDSLTDPPGISETHCTERLVRIDPCFLCYDPGPITPSPRPASRRDGPLRFGSFSAAQKLSRATLDQWSAILRAIPDSTMLIKASLFGTSEARAQVLAEFARRGVASERIELIARVPDPKDHLRLYDRIDIALDTYPYVGTTTICESLLMGVPYLTRFGDQHVSRVGLSLLSCVGVPELCARSIDEFVAIASSLDADRGRLLDYHRTQRASLLSSPLCDGPRFARAFSHALSEAARKV